ncbi:MAG TPA: LPS export ABC transporter periplasmic protein LptC [Beijerinckiaceae bacterium]|jgi:lipopolysaccharide export system protein LptC
MTDTAFETVRPHRAAPLVDRARAFREAASHTRRVRLLRRGILLGSLVIVAGFVANAVFDPFGKLPQGVSLAQATLNGTRITMDLPKLNGYRKDGRPYELRARSGVQDVRNPKVIELNEIEARLETADRSSVRIVAPTGVFDSATDKMNLASDSASGGIRITSTSGYDVVMRSAAMDFKTGSVVSKEPVTVKMTNGSVSADALDIAQNGTVVSFIGNVRSEITPDRGLGAADARAEGNPK